MANKTIDIEFIKAKLADAYIIGQSWADIALFFPEVDKSLFDEISSEIATKLAIGNEQLRPKELYRGIGIETDSCEQGLLAKEIYKDCPAAKLGIEEGDIIISVNFQSVANIDLSSALKKLRSSDYPGGMIIEVMRAGEKMTLGYGLNIQTKVIDAKKKFPMNFTALTIGKRLMMAMQGASSIESSVKLPQKKRSFEMVR